MVRATQAAQSADVADRIDGAVVEHNIVARHTAPLHEILAHDEGFAVPARRATHVAAAHDDAIARLVRAQARMQATLQRRRRGVRRLQLMTQYSKPLHHGDSRCVVCVLP